MSIIETRTRHFPAEYHTTLQVQDGSLSFEDQLGAILKAYSAETAGKEVLLRRFFLSDPANQEACLNKGLASLPAAATSIIGQPPLNGTKIAAWIYAVEGRVVHVDNPEKQAERMLENVEILLKEAGAGFKDIAYCIVYLRDAADYHCVRSLLQRSCPSLAPIYVLAPVCRPAWLVEMECLAITSDGNPSFDSF
ncbi:MAG: hypothetical protein IKU04_01455 [Bacteroidales bacterium]|nr:hypothetical protein [Bacteroidales bacterium]